MAEAAVSLGRAMPRIIKISTKRQITIPADMYEKSGFSDYAYAVWHENGSIEISPIDVRDEAKSVTILRSLLAQGLDGEALVDEYEKIINPVIDFKAEIETSLKEVDEGKSRPFQEFRDEVKRHYEL